MSGRFNSRLGRSLIQNVFPDATIMYVHWRNNKHGSHTPENKVEAMLHGTLVFYGQLGWQGSTSPVRFDDDSSQHISLHKKCHATRPYRTLRPRDSSYRSRLRAPIAYLADIEERCPRPRQRVTDGTVGVAARHRREIDPL